MRQEASKPKPGTKLQVIGGGLAHTGDITLSKALEILLDGPVYHGGTQITRGPETEIRSWINALEHTPTNSLADEKVTSNHLRKFFSHGHASTVEVPAMFFTEELLQMHPDAVVICTVRHPDAWAKSIQKTSQSTLMTLLSLALFLLPIMRWFPRYIDVLPRSRWGELFPHEGAAPDRSVWDHHQKWLREVVPPDRLIFYDIRDGWGPLCEALDKPVPAVPFPKVDEQGVMDAFAKQQILRGLVRWAVVLGSITAVAGVWRWMHN